MDYIDNRNGCILEGEINYYSQIFMNMAIEGNYTHGYTWSLGGKSRPCQVDLETGKVQKLSASDLAVIAIAVSFENEDTTIARLSHQYFLLNLGIVNMDDLENHARDMIKISKKEHATTRHYLIHNTENAAKIVALRRAYEALQKERSWGRLKHQEDRLLLGYVVSLLGGSYELRPYMIDEELSDDESWVDFYDQLFEDFTQESYNRYNNEGYGKIWADFLELRNDIARKKGMNQIRQAIPREIVPKTVRNEVAELLKRTR